MYHGVGAKVGSGATVLVVAGATVLVVGATVLVLGATVLGAGATVAGVTRGALLVVGAGAVVRVGCCLSRTGPALVLSDIWPFVCRTSVNVIRSSSASTSTKCSIAFGSRLNRVGTNEANVVPLRA